MIIWTAWEAPGRDHLDSLGGTREAPEAGKDRLDTREAGKDHLDSLGGTREAPGMQEGTKWTACEAPGRHQGGKKGPIGQPARRQGGTREAEGGTREADKD